MTGFQVSGDSIVCDDPDSRYRGLEFCPFLKPPDGAADADLFRDLAGNRADCPRVATNAPSYLEPVEPCDGDRLPLLAWLPGRCGPEGTNQTAEVATCRSPSAATWAATAAASCCWPTTAFSSTRC